MNRLLVYMPYGGKDYIAFLEKRFNVEVISNLKKAIPNLVFFTGGADINPIHYGEQKGDFTSFNDKRDKEELDLFQYCRAHNIPTLGICRGAQFLCVANGGKLIQHVTGHAIGGLHGITELVNDPFNRDITFNITSTHHQMMYPFQIRKADYRIIAHSTKFLSNIYLNGENENLSVIKDFLEPEIIHFRRANSLAIQGHPEFSHCPKNTVNYCLNLIEKYFNFKIFLKEPKTKSQSLSKALG